MKKQHLTIPLFTLFLLLGDGCLSQPAPSAEPQGNESRNPAEPVLPVPESETVQEPKDDGAAQEKIPPDEPPAPTITIPRITGDIPVELTELPLPLLSFSLYSPRVTDDVPTPVVPELPLPEYRDPVEETPAVKAAPVPKAAPAVTPTPAAVESKEEAPPLRKEETMRAGEIGLVILDGTDWLFLRVREGDRLNYTDRTTKDGKTLFSYDVPGEGTWVLLFQRQNNSTGDTELAEVTLHGENPLPPEKPLIATPAAQPEAPAATGDIVQAQERLKEIEEDPDSVKETLDLLEFLIDAASDDEALAGYYYRTARILEMNSLYQDLRRSYETYEYIRDTFFLTDYYEMAQERLRFLDRHFFKLR